MVVPKVVVKVIEEVVIKECVFGEFCELYQRGGHPFSLVVLQDGK